MAATKCDCEACRLHPSAATKSVSRELLVKGIGQLGISRLTATALRANDVEHVGTLLLLNPDDLLRLRGIGRKGAREIRECLAELDLFLGMALTSETIALIESVSGREPFREFRESIGGFQFTD